MKKSIPLAPAPPSTTANPHLNSVVDSKNPLSNKFASASSDNPFRYPTSFGSHGAKDLGGEGSLSHGSSGSIGSSISGQHGMSRHALMNDVNEECFSSDSSDDGEDQVGIAVGPHSLKSNLFAELESHAKGSRVKMAHGSKAQQGNGKVFGGAGDEQEEEDEDDEDDLFGEDKGNVAVWTMSEYGVGGNAGEREEEIRSRIAASQDAMKHIMDSMTPEQQQRYETFRRVGLSRPAIRRIIVRVLDSITAASLPTASASVPTTSLASITPNLSIVVAGIAKVFVGELVEEARTVLEEWGDDEEMPLMPSHIMEAQRRLEEKKMGNRLRSRPVQPRLFLS